MNGENIDTINWSDWIDFNKNSIDNIPEDEGVYKMHASMKILYIGSSYNLKQSLLESLENSCIKNRNSRSYIYRYAIRI